MNDEVGIANVAASQWKLLALVRTDISDANRSEALRYYPRLLGLPHNVYQIPTGLEALLECQAQAP